MRFFLFTVVYSFLLFTATTAFRFPSGVSDLPADVRNNKYPIIFVNGFLGWGRDEVPGWIYWGSFHGDYQEKLKAEGYEVHTVAIGPFSSNWDRVCELFAQIKGGQVFYGHNHSSMHNHSAYGRTYKGVFPQWGEVVNGTRQKVHLIAHSMGGQTIRMLAQVLAHGTKGSPSEEDPSSHFLFEGNHDDWIHSITTLASPNQGTTLADGIEVIGNVLLKLVSGLFTMAGFFGDSSKQIYDFKLDQWGIAQRVANETPQTYVDRVFKSPLFTNTSTKDICMYSMTSRGAQEENGWVETLPNIYYYSLSNKDSFSTRNWKGKKIQLPNLGMLPPLQPTSVFVGGRFGPEKMNLDESWQVNDGVVPTNSMISDGKSPVVVFQNFSKPGVWLNMPLVENADHEVIVGMGFKDTYPFFKSHAAILSNLPNHEVATRRRLEEGIEHHEHDTRVLEEMQQAIKRINQDPDIKAFCQQTTMEAAKQRCQQVGHYY